jgi:hypothetical protein
VHKLGTNYVFEMSRELALVAQRFTTRDYSRLGCGIAFDPAPQYETSPRPPRISGSCLQEFD